MWKHWSRKGHGVHIIRQHTHTHTHARARELMHANLWQNDMRHLNPDIFPYTGAYYLKHTWQFQHNPVSAHIWDPTGGHMGKIMGPLWATQRGPTWGMIMGFHWDPSGISLGTHMGPRSFPNKSHTNSHMGPNWVCPCISHIYILYMYYL